MSQSLPQPGRITNILRRYYVKNTNPILFYFIFFEIKTDRSGIGEILRTRLKTYYKNYLMGQDGLETPCTQRNYDYLCVIDFEATCEEPTPIDYIQEIIEFPIVLVNTRTMQIVSADWCFVISVILNCVKMRHGIFSYFCLMSDVCKCIHTLY